MNGVWVWRVATVGLAAGLVAAIVWPRGEAGAASRGRGVTTRRVEDPRLALALDVRRPLHVDAEAAGIDEDALIDAASSETNPATVVRIVERLGFVGSDRSVPALGALALDPRRSVAWAAIEALGRIGGDSATDELLTLTEHPRRDLRAQSVVALGNAGTPRAFDRLATIARDRTDPFRMHAIEGLAETQDARMRVVFREILAEGSAAAGQTVVTGLARAGTPEADAMLEELTRHRNQDIRIAATIAHCTIDPERGVARLVAMVETNSPDASIAAARALQDIGATDAVPQLLRIVRNGSAHAKLAAAIALSGLATPEATAELGSLLRSGDRRVARYVAQALADTGEPEALELLAETARQPGPARRFAIYALGNDRSELGLEVMRELVEGAETSQVRLEALGILVEQEDPDAIRTATEWVTTGPMDQRSQAVMMLAATRSPAALDALEALIDDPALTGAVRVHALTSLAEARPEDPRTVERLGQLLVDGRRYDSHAAAAALRRIGTPEARAALVEATESDVSDTAQAAVYALAELADPQDHAMLVEIARTGDPRTRGLALEALVRNQVPGALEIAASMIADPEQAQAATRALSSLVEAGTPEAQAVIDRGIDSPDENVRGAAARSLLAVGAPQATARVRGLLTDPSPQVRGQALSALVDVGAPEAAEIVIEVAGGDDPVLRADAIRYLGYTGDERADGLVAGAMRDDETSVAFAAISAAQDMSSDETERALVGVLLDRNLSQDLQAAAANALRYRGGAAAAQYRARIEELVPDQGIGMY
jgi:HEAT repeat protein